MPVGGSRHYGGPGLGEIGLWKCPSCGAANEGPLTQGCSSCGAGKPGYVPPPPAAAPPARPEPPTHDDAHGDLADHWAAAHPTAGIAEAYRVGYLDGLRAARAAVHAPPEPHPSLAAGAKTYRTLIVALTLFRDQILAGQPEEIQTGEWLSADEATTVLAELHQMLTNITEVAHA